MSGKRSYLLATARSFEMEDISSTYDDQERINVIVRNEELIPLVSEDSFGRTESKTMQAPSDDDPDPEDDGCY
jgi:hypothetical protein